jgi:hypothetical protein
VAERVIAVVVLVAVLLGRGAGASEPVAPKLEPAPQAAPAGEPGARPLPPTVAVCRDRAARRCWTAPRDADCGGVDAVYRVVIAGPGRTDADDALAACRAELVEGGR